MTIFFEQRYDYGSSYQDQSFSKGKTRHPLTNNEPAPSVVYDGEVVNIIPYGAFVRFGHMQDGMIQPFSRDGMVHISEISPQRIENINDVLSIGQKVKVKFIGYDNSNRYKLSIKRADPANDVDARLTVGEIYDGKATKVMDYGVFVDFGFSQDGLVHITEIVPEGEDDIYKFVKDGDTVRVRYLGLDRKGRFKLSISQVDNPRPTAPELSEGGVYTATVENITKHGAFMNFGQYRDGFVHISEIADHRIDRIEDVLSKGDKVQVKFLGYDAQGRFRLSMKQA